jgi:hypothetical protein
MKKLSLARSVFIALIAGSILFLWVQSRDFVGLGEPDRIDPNIRKYSLQAGVAVQVPTDKLFYVFSPGYTSVWVAYSNGFQTFGTALFVRKNVACFDFPGRSEALAAWNPKVEVTESKVTFSTVTGIRTTFEMMSVSD